MLSLNEEIFLLSLLERKDSIRMPSSLSLPFSLAGAVIVELVLSGNVKLEDERLISSEGHEQLTDERMKSALEKIQQTEKPRKLAHWVYTLGAKGKRMAKGITLSFIERGIISCEGNYYHWVSTPDAGDAEQVPVKYLLKREIRDAVLYKGTVSERLVARLVLMDTCDMLDHLFTKDEIVAVRKLVKTMKTDERFTPNYLNLLDRVTEAIEYAISAATTT